MSQVKVQGNASGTGVLTVTSPNTNSNYTLTLPAQTGTLLTTASTGTVLQVLSTTKVDSFSTTSTSFVDVTGLSVTITPTSSTSKILVISATTIGNGVNNAFLNLVRNSTNIAQSTSGSTNESMVMTYPGSYSNLSYSVQYLDSPATTSATTYKMQLRTEGTTVYVNVRATDNYYGSVSSITVMEIAA